MFNELEVFDVLTKRECKSLQDYINYEMQNLKHSSVTKAKYSISMFYIARMQVVMNLENTMLVGRETVNATFSKLTHIYSDAMERLSMEELPSF